MTYDWMQVADAGRLKRKKGIFGKHSVDKEVIPPLILERRLHEYEYALIG